MANDFCDLPRELQIEVLSNLDAVSLIHCAMTCTSIYDIFQGSSLLAYTIELHRDGLKDAGTSLNYPDLIAALRRRRKKWLSLKIKEPLTYLTQHNCDVFELVGGAYADTSKDCLEMRWLPNASNVKAKALQRSSIGISAANFTMDPTQDLMVIVEEGDDPHSLHIRSISTNSIHPQARQSPLQWTNHPYPYTNVVTLNPVIIQIACNILAIFFHNTKRETQVRIWDWTTSDLILDTAISSDPSLLASIDDFRLLDSTYFLITCRSDFGSIRLYRLVRSHCYEAAAQAIHLVTLHLPPTAPGIYIRGIQSEAGPVEANPLPGEPFSIHDDDRLHLFTVVYNHEVAGQYDRENSILNLFLHQRLFLKYARQVTTDNLALDIPWAEWGPLNTRFTYTRDQNIFQSWKRYIHGQRAIFPEGEIEGLYRSVRIVDFSLAAVLFAKGMLDMPSYASSSKRKPPGKLLLSSTIRTEDVPIFLDDVETHLPCVTSILNLKQTNEFYMIYADGFVGADYHDDNNLRLRIYRI
ncbi:hypothetical protein BJ912DRAFT_924971 [Pholiota molesta]|nr:hypothetical protein BJ912DRAFT_924971 [Pholiota molesta]